MNRREEFDELMKELELEIPSMGPSVQHAIRRRARKRIIYRPLSCLMSVFAVFVLLVNFVAPVAYACGRVPGLKELAKAVAFSPSLKAAVENQYVQPIELSQTKNGITVDIEYLIVDQKNIEVFYRIKSDDYEHLDADPKILNIEDERPASCSYSSGSFGVPNGELCNIDISFVDGYVPDKLKIVLSVYDNSPESHGVEEPAPEKEVDYWELDWDDEEYIESFEFILEFDPLFTEQGEIIPAGQSVMLDGQEIVIEELEVYPSHIRVNIGEAAENSAWLKDIDFYIEDDEGRKFEPVSNGTTATGSADTPSMVSYYAESNYFYKAEHLDIVITGAKWLDKEQERIKLNVVTGESDPLPYGVKFVSAERYGKGWVLKFENELQEDEVMYQAFSSKYTDMDGRDFDINMMDSYYGDEDESGERINYYEEFPLRELEGNEVWLYPIATRSWNAPEEIRISIK